MSDRRDCCCVQTYCCTTLNYEYNYALFEDLLERYENIETDPLLPENYQWIVKAKALDGRDELILNMPACGAGGDYIITCPTQQNLNCSLFPPYQPCASGRIESGTTRNTDIHARYKHLKCHWLWYGQAYCMNFDPNIAFCTAGGGDFPPDCFLNQYQEPCKCPVCCQLGETVPSNGAYAWKPRWIPFASQMTETERDCCSCGYEADPDACEARYMTECGILTPSGGECEVQMTTACKPCGLSPYLKRIAQDEYPWAYDIYCYAGNAAVNLGTHYTSDGSHTTANVKLQDIFLGFAFVEHQYQQVDVRLEDLNGMPKIVDGNPTTELAATDQEKCDSWFYFNQRTTPNIFAYAGSGTPIFHFDVYFAEQCGIFDAVIDPVTDAPLTPIEFINRFKNAQCTYRLYGANNPAFNPEYPGYSDLTCSQFESYYAPIQQVLEYMMEAGIVGTTDYRLRMRDEIYEILTNIQEDGSSFFTPWERNPSFTIPISEGDVIELKTRIGYSTWSGPDDIYNKTASEVGFDAQCYAPCRKILLDGNRFDPNNFPDNTSDSMVSENQTYNLQATTSSNWETESIYFGMQAFFRAQKGGWNFYKTIDGCGMICQGGDDPCSVILLANYNAEKDPNDPTLYGNTVTGFLERNWLAKDSYQTSYRAVCTTLSIINGSQFSNSSVGGGEDPCNSNMDFIWAANGIPSLRECIDLGGSISNRCQNCTCLGCNCGGFNSCNGGEDPYCCANSPNASCDDFCGHVGFYGNEEIFVNSFSKYARADVSWECGVEEPPNDPPDGSICAHAFSCYSYVAFSKRYAELTRSDEYIVYGLASTPWTPPTGYEFNVLAPLHRVPTQTNKALCGLRCGCYIDGGSIFTTSDIAGPGGVGVCGWCTDPEPETSPAYVVGGPTQLTITDDYSKWNF